MTVTITLTGCSWGGINSIPLPGAPGQVPGAQSYTAEMANVGSLENNSPVLLNNVVIGSVGGITVRNWHADVEILVKPGIVVPGNALAVVGQTSLLGSSHLALDPPVGQAPRGQLPPGAVLKLSESSTYPSTEQTLAALSAVVNGGGLGQVGDIVHSFNAAFSNRQNDFRDLISRLDTFVDVFDAQRDDVVATLQALNRLTGTIAGQRDELAQALQKIPPALEVLLRERPRLTTALDKLRALSETATSVIAATKADLVSNLTHLEPAIRALADVGRDLDKAIAFATVFPYGQNTIDKAVRGDYINQITTLDFTVPRLKKELLMGTRWGDPNAQLQAAVGDPGFAEQTGNPLAVGITPPPLEAVPPAGEPAPVPAPEPAATPAPSRPADTGGR
ncbi:MCE family protein [Mycobacterium sp. 48b]|uniref:MCE family protein n=1 Tax=Mycobacterium sp. 48b TaxID=3400426 RepID=UPI003AAF654B